MTQDGPGRFLLDTLSASFGRWVGVFSSSQAPTGVPRVPAAPGKSADGEGRLLSVRCILLFRPQVTSDFVSDPEKLELSCLPSALCPGSAIANYTTWRGGGRASRRASVSPQLRRPKPRCRRALPAQKALEEDPACALLTAGVAGTPCL